MAETLYDYFTSKGGTLPPLKERASMYAALGLGSSSSYTGTAAQNTALLSKLQTATTPTATPQQPAPTAPTQNPQPTNTPLPTTPSFDPSSINTGQFSPLPAIPAAPAALPQSNNQTATMQFASALQTALDLARQKRNAVTLDTMGKAFEPGLLTAGSFGSVLANVNRAGQSYGEGLTNAAIGALEFDLNQQQANQRLQFEQQQAERQRIIKLHEADQQNRQQLALSLAGDLNNETMQAILAAPSFDAAIAVANGALGAKGQSNGFTLEQVGQNLVKVYPDGTTEVAFSAKEYEGQFGSQDVRSQITEVGGRKKLIDLNTGAVIQDLGPADGGSGPSSTNLSTSNRTALLGAGFNNQEVSQIEQDVNTFGLEAVVNGMDTTQANAIREAYGQQPKVTREQIQTTVTQKVAADGLRDSYTDDELKDLADQYGYSSFWTGKSSDIERFLNSPEAKDAYVDLLYNQYKANGMAI